MLKLDPAPARVSRKFLALLCFSLPASARGAEGGFDTQKLDQWHQWRGPEANGAAPRGDPPIKWSESANIRFKVAIPGEGHSSPIVWGDRVFILSAERTDRTGEPPQVAATPQKTVPPKNVYRFLVTAFDRKTGAQSWSRTAVEEVPHEGRHDTNTYASCSPTTDGRLLYVSFGSRGLYAYTLDGELKWKRDLGKMKTRLGWGEGSSPVIRDDRLIVNWDVEGGGSFIAALYSRTGDTRWKIDRDESSSWTTPLIIDNAGITQVVVNGQNRVRSYDFRDGKLIWECGGQTANPIPSPVSAAGVVYCMSGYRGNAARAISLDAKGDVTESEMIRWRLGKGTPYVPSPVLAGERLYFTGGNSNVLTCVEAKTGKVLIEGTRLEGLKTLYASPVAAAGRLYFIDRDGSAVVIREGDKLEILATNKLDDSFSATPAIAGKQMYLRGSRFLYCLEDGAMPAGGDPKAPESKGASGF